MPLSTQEYKLVPANCWGNLTNCREVTCDGLASRPGEVEILLAASCYSLDWDKLRQLWASLGSKASLFYFILYIKTLDYDLLKDNGTFSEPMISRKTITRILCGNFEESSLKCEKMASRKIFRYFLHVIFFMFILLISNHTVSSRSNWN